MVNCDVELSTKQEYWLMLTLCGSYIACSEYCVPVWQNLPQQCCWQTRHSKVYTLQASSGSEHLLGHPDTFIMATAHCTALAYSDGLVEFWPNKSWSWQRWEERAAHQNMSHTVIILPILILIFAIVLIILAVVSYLQLNSPWRRAPR